MCKKSRFPLYNAHSVIMSARSNRTLIICTVSTPLSFSQSRVRSRFRPGGSSSASNFPRPRRNFAKKGSCVSSQVKSRNLLASAVRNRFYLHHQYPSPTTYIITH